MSMFRFWPEDNAGARDFSTVLVGLLSESTQGAADPNELLRVAARIRSGDREDWTREFAAMAAHLLAMAEEAEEKGRAQTAAETYFRAFTCFRVAELKRPHDDPRKIPLYRQSLACFQRGLALSSHLHERVRIPYDGMELEGYYFPPQRAATRHLERGGRTPCVIYLSGADALPEQNFFRGAQWLTSRGLACLLFNGPGQGGSIRLLGLPTLPEYERPVGAAVDYLQTRPDVDADRIALMGVSMAGYYGMRAAAFEPRLKAVVAWGAMYSVLEDLWRHYPPLRRQLVWITGAKSEEEAERRLGAFTLEGVLGRVRCPALVTHGLHDEMVPVASAQRTYDELGSTDKALRIYTPEEGGEAHINIDNWSQVVPPMADWLVERLQ